MKQIFYKTVRSDYRSVYARGRMCRKYEIGKRYRFPKLFPAHVFTTGETDTINSDDVYFSRKEASGGNRVLVCYGEVESRDVPCFEIDADVWDLRRVTNDDHYPTANRQTSTDFVVLGEIALPKHFNGVRPDERPSRAHMKVKDDLKSLMKIAGSKK